MTTNQVFFTLHFCQPKTVCFWLSSFPSSPTLNTHCRAHSTQYAKVKPPVKFELPMLIKSCKGFGFEIYFYCVTSQSRWELLESPVISKWLRRKWPESLERILKLSSRYLSMMIDGPDWIFINTNNHNFKQKEDIYESKVISISQVSIAVNDGRELSEANH